MEKPSSTVEVRDRQRKAEVGSRVFFEDGYRTYIVDMREIAHLMMGARLYKSLWKSR